MSEVEEPQAEELVADPQVPPWEGGAQITQSQLYFLGLRRGQEDYEKVLIALRDNGSLTVVPDP